MSVCASSGDDCCRGQGGAQIKNVEDQEGDELRVMRRVSDGDQLEGTCITDQEDFEPCHRVLLLDGATVRALLAEDCVRHPLTEGRVGRQWDTLRSCTAQGFNTVNLEVEGVAHISPIHGSHKCGKVAG